MPPVYHPAYVAARVIDPASLPILYGTAWKEDQTARLVTQALRAGFRGIDTANQRKHYHEAQVGEAVAAFIAAGHASRDGLFLQTKFTFIDGQDHRLPYDPKAAVATQVRQSFDKSLEHLRTDWLDSLVLHGPSQRVGLGEADWEAWRAMEALAGSGKVKRLGVSNVSLTQLEQLVEGAKHAPQFVQNRCYANRGWDREVRLFCRARAIRYQGFSLLTANPQVVQGAAVKKIARRLGRTPAQVIYRFALQAGMLPLTGTTDPAHVSQALELTGFELTAEEVRELEGG
jgi:diketogulonate reductase-like aldo/keto reductase